MVSDSAEHHGNFEKTFAVNALVASIATTSAPLLLGFISDRLGIIAAFNTMALLALIATIPAYAFQQNKKH
jgi:NADH:ubiquinone oxidoreductase subunit 4 (subunit M)